MPNANTAFVKFEAWHLLAVPEYKEPETCNL
jgi:hypothetical protein